MLSLYMTTREYVSDKCRGKVSKAVSGGTDADLVNSSFLEL